MSIYICYEQFYILINELLCIVLIYLHMLRNLLTSYIHTYTSMQYIYVNFNNSIYVYVNCIVIPYHFNTDTEFND